MDWIREYLLSIIAAGAVCGICTSLIPKNTSSAVIIKMLGGIFLAITLIAPLAKIRLDDLGDYWNQITLDAEALAQEGSAATREELALVIKEELESYILDKADTMGLTLQLSVIMDHEDPPMPQQVRISGAVSPYQQKLLSQWIAEELGITEEQQVWN